MMIKINGLNFSWNKYQIKKSNLNLYSKEIKKDQEKIGSHHVLAKITIATKFSKMDRNGQRN